MLFEHGGEREDIADVVIDHQHLFAGKSGVVPTDRRENLPLRLGKIRFRAVQEEHRFVEEAAGRLGVPDNARPRQAADFGFKHRAPGGSAAKHDGRRVRPALRLDLFQ